MPDKQVELGLSNLRKQLKTALRNAPDVEVAWRMVTSDQVDQDLLSRTLLQAFIEIYE